MIRYSTKKPSAGTNSAVGLGYGGIMPAKIAKHLTKKTQTKKTPKPGKQK